MPGLPTLRPEQQCVPTLRAVCDQFEQVFVELGIRHCVTAESNNEVCYVLQRDFAISVTLHVDSERVVVSYPLLPVHTPAVRCALINAINAARAVGFDVRVITMH